MGDCLVLYRMTGDERYREALFRAASGSSTRRSRARPRDGRRSTTSTTSRSGRASWSLRAADTVFGTYGAGSGLMLLYDITGDGTLPRAPAAPTRMAAVDPAGEEGWLWYAHRSWTADEKPRHG